jgi:APA family basic amino acid/polyamine antiporter
VRARQLRILGLAFGVATVAAADALEKVYGPSARAVITVLALVATLSVLNVCVLLAPRILYGMGRDGLFLSSGTYLTRQGVPLVGTWLSAAGAIVVANVGGFDTLYTATAFLNASDYLLCGGASFALRRRQPDLRRPYRAFGYPWIPGIALLTAAVLLVVFVLGNTLPSLLAIAVVAVTYPLFRFLRSRRSPPQETNGK